MNPSCPAKTPNVNFLDMDEIEMEIEFDLIDQIWPVSNNSIM